MSHPTDSSPGLLQELKRRKVVRAGLLYGAAAFAVLQVADIVVEPLGLPAWSMSALVRLVIVGFPVTVVVAWFVDLPGSRRSDRRWVSVKAAIAVVLLVAVGVAGWVLRPTSLTEPPSRAADPDANELETRFAGLWRQADPELRDRVLERYGG